MANGAISWASQQQKMVTFPVGEAEYMELASTGQQAAWLRSFSREIGFPIEGPILLQWATKLFTCFFVLTRSLNTDSKKNLKIL